MLSFLNIDPILFKNIFGTGISIYWYGVIITLGVLAGIVLATKDCKRKGYSTDLPLDLALIAVIIAVIFARLYYVVFDTTGIFTNGTFAQNLNNIISIWDGGLAIYGAIIGALLALFIYSLFNKKYTFIQLLDLGAAPLALGQAIGRWGNFFNQEAFGNAVKKVELQWFPYAVHLDNPKGAFDAGWYQATFFYESMWCLAIAAFVFWFYKKQKYAGQAVILYFTLYSFERAIVEPMRLDSLLIPGTQLRVSFVLSVILFIIGVGLLLYFAKRPPKALIKFDPKAALQTEKMDTTEALDDDGSEDNDDEDEIKQ